MILQQMALARRRQVLSEDAAELARIYEADVNMVAWQRVLEADVCAYTQWLLEHRLPLVWQEVIKGAELRPRAKHLLPSHPARQAFIDDLNLVVDMFCCLFELDAVGVRLRVLDRATCPSFHTDRVPCRLITCFGGGGTQWRDGSSGGALQQLGEGHIALLKGDAWQGNAGCGLVHRSPPLASPQSRLLLTLDFG